MLNFMKDKEVLLRLKDSNGIEVEVVVTVSPLDPIGLCKVIWDLQKEFNVYDAELIN